MFGRKRNRETDPWQVFETLVVKDRTALLPWERRLVAFGYLRQEVNSGGFHAYLSEGYGALAREAIAAAEAVGEQDLAALTSRALLVLEGVDPADAEACQEALDGVDEHDADLDALDEEFYALERRADLDAAMRGLLPDTRQ